MGRPRFSGAFVEEMMLHTGIGPGSRIVEIGAGTGQLTEAMLAADLRVIALEPDPRLASLLRTVGHRTDLTVIQEDFESWAKQSSLAVDLIVAANSFHWLDPEVSYSLCAHMVGSRGRIFLTWTYPIFRDAELQRLLNEHVFVGEFASLQRDPVTHLTMVEEVCAEGREELRQSGVLKPIRWTFQVEHLCWTVERVLALWASFASVVGLETLLRERFERYVPDEAELELLNIIYYVIAEATPGTE